VTGSLSFSLNQPVSKSRKDREKLRRPPIARVSNLYPFPKAFMATGNNKEYFMNFFLIAKDKIAILEKYIIHYLKISMLGSVYGL